MANFTSALPGFATKPPTVHECANAAKEALEQLPEDDKNKLLALPHFRDLYSLYSRYQVRPKTVAISKCKPSDIERILGVKLPQIESRDINWFQEQTFAANYEPSELFERYFRFLESFVKRNCEPTTRTWIDLFIFEALSDLHGSDRLLKMYGEISIARQNQVTYEILSGSGDYVIGFGEAQEELLVQNILVVGEAKGFNVGVQRKGIWQLLAYMLIVHQARKEAKKQNANVFGFASDSDEWSFYRIDNAGKIWRSQAFGLSKASTVLQYLRYMFETARASSPSTTPFASESELHKNPLFESWQHLADFEPVHCMQRAGLNSTQRNLPGFALKTLLEDDEDDYEEHMQE